VKNFIKSEEAELKKNLERFKPHTLESLYSLFKSAFPEDFTDISQENFKALA
jgi:hypothetical protein